MVYLVHFTLKVTEHMYLEIESIGTNKLKFLEDKVKYLIFC